MKKIGLKSVSDFLSDNQLKLIMGGYDPCGTGLICAGPVWICTGYGSYDSLPFSNYRVCEEDMHASPGYTCHLAC